MHIEKRSIGKFILLDILTFGIYGIVALHKMGEDVNTLCKGDGNRPRFGYGMVWFLPFLGSIGASICGLIGYLLVIGGTALLNTGSTIAALLAVILFAAALAATGCATVGTFAPLAYNRFWWYEQNNRLKLNAGRYNVEIRESGLSVMAWQTLGGIAGVGALLALLFSSSFAIPYAINIAKSLVPTFSYNALEGFKITTQTPDLLGLIVTIVLAAFFVTAAVNIGKYISTAFMIKNLNRLADASRVGGERFDAMGYAYYDADCNFVAHQQKAYISSGSSAKAEKPAAEAPLPGKITCVHGPLSGYSFDLTAGEELVIGKDASFANIVVDPAYKEVSRKHVGIRFDLSNNSYRVTDYSSNGTFVGGTRLTKGIETTLSRRTEISLANSKITFRLE